MAAVHTREEDTETAPVPPGDNARYSGPDGLRSATSRGSLVYGLFSVALTVLGLIKGFLVAGFLTPVDYGIWGLLAVSLGTLLWLTQLGFDDKYIQQDDADQERAFQLAFTLNCILGALFMVIMLASLPLFALAYGRWDIVAPGALLTLAVPAAALQMPQWFYFRKMDFVKERMLQSFDPLVSIPVTVGLAAAGMGYWAVVIGTVAGGWSAAAAAVRARPYPMRPRWEPHVFRSYVSFSWPLFVASASGVSVAQSSVLVAQNVAGTAAVGAIALGSTISQYTARVDGMVSTSLYSAVCAAKDRTEIMFEAFSKSNRLALLWGVPCGVGIALFTPDLVRFWLGDRWDFAIPVIQAFGLGAAMNQICSNWSVFFRARGETRPMAVEGVAMLVAVLLVAIPLLIWEGVEGYAIGMIVATAVIVAVRVIYLSRIFPGFQIWSHTLRAVWPTIPALIAVVVLRSLFPEMDEHLGGALTQMLVFVAVVALLTFTAERALIREIISYLRRRSSTPSPLGPVS